MNKKFAHTALALAVAGSINATLVQAQSEPGLVLEEVIVTAQKREESVQDVPSTVNVLQGRALEEFKVFNFTDLESLTSGVSITRDTGRSGSISMRGVNFDPNSAAEAAVTVNWNGSLVDGNTVFQQMFDVDRVEILRGPQGTLQGRSSPGGAINIYTTRPDMEEMTGQIRTSVQDNDGFNTQFGLSYPLIEGVVAVRIAGVYDESDLNEVENVVNGDTTHDETKAGRISVSWLATQDLSFDLAYEYLDSETDSLNVLEGEPLGSPVLDPDGILTPLDAFDKKGASVGTDNTDADFSHTTLAINWDLPGHLLTSITGYHETDSDRVFDRSEGNANPENLVLRYPDDDREDFTQEIRLTSTENENWEYMLGAYYENSDVKFQQDNYIRVGHPFAPADQVLKFPAETDRYGVFTHNKLYLSQQWTAQFGLRWQRNEVSRDITVSAGAAGFPPDYQPGDLILDVLDEEYHDYNDDALTGSASIEYAFTETDVSVYLSYTTGWRPGGVTVGGAVLPEDLLLFDDEDSAALELGFKSMLWNDRLRLNGAVFYQDFEDYIARIARVNVRQLQPDGSYSASTTQNGLTSNADAEIWGAEIEFDALLMENWTAGGAISYTDATYDSGETLPCNVFDDEGNPAVPPDQGAAVCDVGGQTIGITPDWSASLRSEYTIPFNSFDGYGRVLYRFVGERPNEEIGDQDSYSVVDMYVGVRNENWDLSVYARNLFDEEEVIDGSLTTEPVARLNAGYGPRKVVPSRIYGASVSYNF